MDSSALSAGDIAGMVSAGVAIGTLFGGIIGWFLRARKDRIAVTPIFTYRDYAIEIINRCDEPLRITCITASCPVGLGNWTYDEGGSVIGETTYDTPCDPGWEIAPLSTKRFPFSTKGASIGSIKLKARSALATVNSSFKIAV